MRWLLQAQAFLWFIAGEHLSPIRNEMSKTEGVSHGRNSYH
jgi:hypothetical protein